MVIVAEQLRRQTARFFTTYVSSNWMPGDNDSYKRWFNATNVPRGAIVLWPLVRLIQEHLKIDVTNGLVARSKYHPDMLRAQLERFESGGKMGKVDNEAWHYAYQKMLRMFKFKPVSPLPVGEVPFISSSNSGAPLFMKKGDCHLEGVKHAREVLRGRKPHPATIFHRGKDEETARPVLGYPFEMSLLEGKFFYPLQNALLQQETAYAGGLWDHVVASKLNEIRVKSRFIAEIDYSGFDGSISSRLINMAFEVLSRLIDFTTKEDVVAWSIVKKYFISCPLLAPDGRVYHGKKHGVPSGSNFTQMIDSIVNCFAVEYCRHRLKLDITRYIVLGDDSVFGFNSVQELSEFVSAAAELGLRVSVDKSSFKPSTADVHFLGHDWATMRGLRPVLETLQRLVTPERNRKEYWDKDPSIRRAAFVERIRAYQDDNPAAWKELSTLIHHLVTPGNPQNGKYLKWNELFFQPSETTERKRWNPSKVESGSKKHRCKTIFV